MSRYDITQWTDFVRGLVDEETGRHMQVDLDGDPVARRTVAALSRVAQVAERDEAFAVPEAALRSVHALGAIGRPEADGASTSLLGGLRRLAMNLTFDSSLAPAMAGVRDMQSAHHQLFYELDDVAVELRHEPHTGGGVVVGQMMRVGAEAAPLTDVPVIALAQGQVVARTATGPLGEFQADELPPKDLDLLFIFSDKCLEVSLPTSDR